MTAVALFENDEFRLEFTPDPVGGYRVPAPAVARQLSFRDAHRLMESIPDGEKGYTTACTPGGDQRIGYLTEAGFYRALGQRQAARINDGEIRAKVERFQAWVFGVVLPGLRRGDLVPAQREPSRRELAVMVIEAEDRAEEAARQRAIEAEGRAIAEGKVAELAPAAHSWTTLAEAHGDFSVADAAKILANDPAIDMGRDRLYDLLGELGWTFRSGDKGRWQPYQREIERGRLRTRFRSYDHPTTGKRVTASPDIRLTVKAIQWLHTHLGGTGEVQFPAEQLTIPGGAA